MESKINEMYDILKFGPLSQVCLEAREEFDSHL